MLCRESMFSEVLGLWKSWHC